MHEMQLVSIFHFIFARAAVHLEDWLGAWLRGVSRVVLHTVRYVVPATFQDIRVKRLSTSLGGLNGSWLASHLTHVLPAHEEGQKENVCCRRPERKCLTLLEGTPVAAILQRNSTFDRGIF